LKIAYIFTRFPAPSETFACNDVRTLRGLGVDISVYTQRAAHPDSKRMISERGLSDVPVTNCGIREGLGGCVIALSHPFLLIRMLWWITRHDLFRFVHWLKCLALVPASFFILGRLESERPDIVHLFWGHYQSLVGYLVRERLPMSKLSMFLGAYDLEMRLGISVSTARTADHLFTHAEANLLQLRAMGIVTERVNVVRRGVDVEAIDSIDPEHVESDVHFPILSCVARLVERKGIQDAIHAVPLLKERYPRIKLFIAGEGPYQNVLSKEVRRLGLSNHVAFLGHIPHRAVIALLKSTHVFVLPTRCTGERLPNVIKEAMLCGAIPVTTVSPGIEELISPGVDGIILESGGADDIARVIANLIENDEGRRSMVELARNKVAGHFSLDVQMKKYISMWNSR
jgi:glycosyltransferase involved in cell wall biosynthesis